MKATMSKSNNEDKFIKMLFDPDKLDDNDPRKITFLKQQEDQRQRAQKQPVDQENSDKVRPNPNAIATITPTKSAAVASNGNPPTTFLLTRLGTRSDGSHPQVH